MLTPLVILWLGAPGQLGTHRPTLADWANARGAIAVSPEAPTAPHYDARLADDIEALLEQARSEVPTPGSSSAFERAEAILLAHPELPQAAWLLAERYALEAHAGGSERSLELEARAAALDGGRAASASAAPVSAAAATAPSMAASRSPALALSGQRPLDQVYVDGVLADATPVISAGRHHVQLVRGALTVTAAWVEVGPTSAPTIADPTRACSSFDLAAVSDGAEHRPAPAPGVLCQRWAAARPGALGGTELASCRGSVCGPWEPAPVPQAGPGGAPGAGGEPNGRWPAWLTWSLLGAGAAATTGIVLWQTGAFERPEQSTEFVFTGPDATGYRF